MAGLSNVPPRPAVSPCVVLLSSACCQYWKSGNQTVGLPMRLRCRRADRFGTEAIGPHGRPMQRRVAEMVDRPLEYCWPVPPKQPWCGVPEVPWSIDHIR
jgi:hypothetical protein